MEQPINEPFTSEESQEIYQNFKTIINSRLDKLYNSKGSDGEQYAYSIAVKQMRKKQAEKLAEPTTEEPMEQGDKLKEMIQSALSKPLSEKKKSSSFTSQYDDTLNEIENAEDFSDLVYKDMWNDLLAWAKSNRTSSRKNAKYPSESKQEAYLLSIAPKYQVDVNILKKALKQYDDLHNRTYGMIPGGLIWQEWVDAKINKYSNKNSNNFMKFEEGKKEDVTEDGKIDSKDYLAKRDIAIQKAKSKVKEDLDLGHEDNEPHMLKADLYRIGKYAMELYKMVDQFEGDQEVDFPHWWQAKIIEAKNMLVSAKHYLDFEIKEPQLDAMVNVASEEGAIDEMSKKQIKKRGEIFDTLTAKGMPDEKAGKIATSTAMKKKIKEAILAKLK